VGKAADALPLPFPVHDDGSDVRAPICGVVAGLRLAASEVCAVIPVDVPFLTSDAVEALVTACADADADAAVPATGPLPGAYRKTALATLERRVERGRLALWQALRELRVITVALDERLLANINTPQDLP
jgi:molybdopterin-guanine dinucleotide biosynthesis protein A